MRAVLSNPLHPERGQVTVTFPLPKVEYDHCVEQLEALGIGDILQRDCRVEELDSTVTASMEGNTSSKRAGSLLNTAMWSTTVQGY